MTSGDRAGATRGREGSRGGAGAEGRPCELDLLQRRELRRLLHRELAAAVARGSSFSALGAAAAALPHAVAALSVGPADYGESRLDDPIEGALARERR